jgi:hypothetical protein
VLIAYHRHLGVYSQVSEDLTAAEVGDEILAEDEDADGRET